MFFHKVVQCCLWKLHQENRNSITKSSAPKITSLAHSIASVFSMFAFFAWCFCPSCLFFGVRLPSSFYWIRLTSCRFVFLCLSRFGFLIWFFMFSFTSSGSFPWSSAACVLLLGILLFLVLLLLFQFSFLVCSCHFRLWFVVLSFSFGVCFWFAFTNFLFLNLAICVFTIDSFFGFLSFQFC